MLDFQCHINKFQGKCEISFKWNNPVYIFWLSHAQSLNKIKTIDFHVEKQK